MSAKQRNRTCRFRRPPTVLEHVEVQSMTVWGACPRQLAGYVCSIERRFEALEPSAHRRGRTFRPRRKAGARRDCHGRYARPGVLERR
jgi:hypothetical protein